MAGRIGDHELRVFGMAPDECLDEWADRDDVKSPGTGVVERSRDERRTEPAAAQVGIDLGVQERDHATAPIAVHELPRGLTGGQQHVPALVGAILDGEVVVGQTVRVSPDRLGR